jgi:hypothetical protein
MSECEAFYLAGEACDQVDALARAYAMLVRGTLEKAAQRRERGRAGCRGFVYGAQMARFE